MIKTPVRDEAKLVFNDDESDLERRLKRLVESAGILKTLLDWAA